MAAYTPAPGMVHNPLRSGNARNLPCPCGSEKKAKKCCGRYDYMKVELAKKVSHYIDNCKGIPSEVIKQMMRKEKAAAEAKMKEEDQIKDAHSEVAGALK